MTTFRSGRLRQPVASESTNGLAAAEAFFNDHTFKLGSLGAEPQTFELTYTLVASAIGDGFGFTYDTAIPEASTWLSGSAALAMRP